MQTTFVHGAGTVADALAAFQVLLDFRVMFPTLKFIERRQVRVLVTKRDDETDINAIVRRVIKKAAALGVIIERPPSRMHNKTLVVFRGVNLPALLQANAVMLRIGVFAEIKALRDLLAKIAANALGENRIFSKQFVAGLVTGLLLAVLANAHVAGGNTGNATLLVVQHFRSRKSGKYVDAKGFGLLAKPLA